MNTQYREDENFNLKINLNQDDIKVNVNMEEDAFNTKFIVLKGESGTTDYNDLENKPSINNVELSENKTSDDLGLQPKGDYANTRVTNIEIDNLF